MDHEDQKIKRIDIREVFATKNPLMARMLPGFVYSYLKRILHQDDLNHYIFDYQDKTGFDFVKVVINEFNVDVEIVDFENVPENGKFIFASNHPLGGFDALLLLSHLNKKYTEIKVLVNDLLMNIPNLRPLFIPINKHGKQHEEAVKELDELYKSESQILTFPAGLVSRRIKGQIIDLEWKKNFIQKAIQYKRDIIPVFVSGRNSNFFYNLSAVRKFLGIKVNIEMFFLSDETFSHKNKKFTIKFGKPIPYQVFDKSKTYAEWAKWVKERLYELNGIKTISI